MSKCRIYRPYKFKVKEIDLLKKHKPTNSCEWIKSIYNELKEEIKDHLEMINYKKCFYCKTKIKGGIDSSHIEHIVDKDSYPEFMFEPRNLTLCCPRCNSAKSTQNVFSTVLLSPTNYPVGESEYIIVHAYFDDYDKHIEIVNDIFHIPHKGSNKGFKTIKMCNLTRHKLAEDKIGELIIKKFDEHEDVEVTLAREALLDENKEPDFSSLEDLRCIKQIITKINDSKYFYRAYDKIHYIDYIFALINKIDVSLFINIKTFIKNITNISKLYTLSKSIKKNSKLNLRLSRLANNTTNSNPNFSKDLLKLLLFLEIVDLNDHYIWTDINDASEIRNQGRKCLAGFTSIKEIYSISELIVKVSPIIILLGYISNNNKLKELINAIPKGDIDTVDKLVKKINNKHKFEVYTDKIKKIIFIYKCLKTIDMDKINSYKCVINDFVSTDLIKVYKTRGIS